MLMVGNCILAGCVLLCSAGEALTVQEPGAAELEAVRAAIQRGDFETANDRCFAYGRVVLALQRAAGPAQTIPKELKYTPSPVDSSYLLVMVDQVKQMQASGDLLSTLRYAGALQQALNRERLRRQPSMALQLEEVENRLVGESRFERYLDLPLAAQLAVEAGANEKARRYSNELLLTAAAHEKAWPQKSRGEAIYRGHLVLARVDLRDGDVEAARRHLIEASGAYSNSYMVFQGPDKRLIAEFLDKGEKDAVLDYLKQCAKSWKADNGETAHWIALIEKGERPWFAKLKLK
ncbi:MAG: hypothetical protein HZB13_07895 [Acidobacteria bacterium]|nr:hypothetical protein [Acidobacteriota bacterium]